MQVGILKNYIIHFSYQWGRLLLNIIHKQRAKYALKRLAIMPSGIDADTRQQKTDLSALNKHKSTKSKEGINGKEIIRYDSSLPL